MKKKKKKERKIILKKKCMNKIISLNKENLSENNHENFEKKVE